MKKPRKYVEDKESLLVVTNIVDIVHDKFGTPVKHYVRDDIARTPISIGSHKNPVLKISKVKWISKKKASRDPHLFDVFKEDDQ